MRQESIWQNSIAFSCSSCLKITLFCATSPVATPMPSSRSASAIALCPTMSSQLVGSSIHIGLVSASAFMHAMASGTSHFWFASIIRKLSSPISSRMALARMRSSSGSGEPTFILKYLWPSASSSLHSARILSSG